jgi:negative regulator of flagellin synthesis FlgM
MTDKINGQGFRPADTAASGTRRSDAAKLANSQGQGRAAATDKSSATASDTVSITQSGLLMSKLEELVQSTPVVDRERVAAIKDALASGTYEIDDRQVAERLLKFERDVLG